MAAVVVEFADPPALEADVLDADVLDRGPAVQLPAERAIDVGEQRLAERDPVAVDRLDLVMLGPADAVADAGPALGDLVELVRREDLLGELLAAADADR